MQDRPTMVFDGDCGFCRTWIGYWKQLTDSAVEYVAYQGSTSRFPDIPPAQFRGAVHFISTDGKVSRAAEAVFMALAVVPGKRGWLWAYRHLPLFAPATEAFYRFIAGHRPFAASMTRLLWGARLEKAEYVLSRWVFLRVLGSIYAVAFLSLFVQIGGLVGRQGLMPAANFLAAASGYFGAAKYRLFPTLAWISSGDVFLHATALAGLTLSLLVIAGVLVRPALVLLYACYLSLFVAGQTFLSFQWDILLLEMGFLAIFFAPRTVLPRLKNETRPSTAVRWLFWLLLFRLMWSSGLVKIFSGDATWRDLTALSYHYFTQPIPNPLSWYMHQLPLWFHKAETLASLAIELAVPFLVFAPRRLRFAGAWTMIAFQAFLQLTGNYTAFNLQTIALCLLLFDDQFYGRFFSKRAVDAAVAVKDVPLRNRFAGHVRTVSLGVMFLANGSLILGLATGGRAAPSVADAFYRFIQPFHIVNSYGAFAVMTTTRPEVVIEGSDNGTTWKEYGFRYKVSDVMRMPPVVAPHHPRLDWQMWFLQFSRWQDNPWFFNLMVRLLQGSPDVLALLATDPFPTHPPKYVRALLYHYRFTTPEERARTGAWWQRELKGEYFPIQSLESLPGLFDRPENGDR